MVRARVHGFGWLETGRRCCSYGAVGKTRGCRKGEEGILWTPHAYASATKY